LRKYLDGTGIPPPKAQDARCRNQETKDAIDDIIKKGVGSDFLNDRIAQAVEDMLRHTDNMIYMEFVSERSTGTNKWYAKALPENHRLFNHVPFDTFQKRAQEKYYCDCNFSDIWSD